MKIAIVTGASSGMGKEFAQQIARRYSGLQEIWVIARRKEKLDALAEEIERTYSVSVKVLALDLTKDVAIEQLNRELAKAEANVKLLVNSAGFGKIGCFKDGVRREQAEMVRLNCEALVAVTSVVLPFMSRNSRIIQLASTAAYLPQPYFAVYAATKAFVYSFSKALNKELKAQEIYVTAVCPGPVKTEFFHVAETHARRAAYKKYFMYDAKDVVTKALMDSAAGFSESICGISMQGLKAICKLIPHDFLLEMMARFYKRGA